MVEQKTSSLESNEFLENKITAIECTLEQGVLRLIDTIQKAKHLYSERKEFVKKLDSLLAK